MTTQTRVMADLHTIKVYTELETIQRTVSNLAKSGDDPMLTDKLNDVVDLIDSITTAMDDHYLWDYADAE